MIGIMTAAGKGTRMKALTGMDIPKVLLHINKKPIIAYGIESMQEMGVEKIYIVALKAYKDLFEKELKTYENIEFCFVDESNHVMDSLSCLADFVLNDDEYDGSNAVYWLADNIFIGDDHKKSISDICQRMDGNVPSTGLILLETKTPKDFITMKKDGSFEDKPIYPETNLSASGVFVVNEAALKETERRILNVNANEFTIWDSWMQFHEIVSKTTTDVWIDVGTPERYLEVKKTLEQ